MILENTYPLTEVELNYIKTYLMQLVGIQDSITHNNEHGLSVCSLINERDEQINAICYFVAQLVKHKTLMSKGMF